MKKYLSILKSNYLYYYFIGLFIFILSLNNYLFIVALICYLIIFRNKYSKVIMSILFFLIILLFIFNNYKAKIKTIDNKATIVEVSNYNDNNRLTLKINRRKYYLYTKKNFNVGDIVLVKGSVVTKYEYKTPGSFNINKYYKSIGVYGEIKDYNLTILNKTNNLYKAKLLINDNYLKIFLNLAKIDDDTNQKLKDLNIITLFSLSGIHIYFLIKLIRKIMFYFNLEQKIQDGIIIFTLATIFFCSNFAFGIFRILCYYLLKNIKRRREISITNYSLMNLSYLITLIFYSYLITNTGFLISYLIVSALHLFKEYQLSEYFIVKQFKIGLMISLITLPFYNNFNMVNLIFYPVYYILVVYVIFPLSILNNFMGSEIISKLIQVIVNLITISRFNDYKIVVSSISSLSIFIYYLLIILKASDKINYKILILSIMLLISIPKLKLNLNEGELYFLDSGQGDSSIFIKNGEVVVIDAYNNTVSFLENKGVIKIKYLILTHNHLDHTKEAEEILDRFKVEYLILNNYDDYQIKKSYKTKNKIIKNEEVINEKGYSIFFYDPLKDYNDSNNNSLVLKLTFNDTKVLFTGDIEKEREVDLVNNYGALLKSDILKVAHHGSDSSSSEKIIYYVKPKYALISAGIDNKFGFPSINTLKTLEIYNVKYFITWQEGTIKVKNNNNIKPVKDRNIY